MGLSMLSGILCNSTTSTPYGDVSYDKLSGRELSKCTNSKEDFRAVLVSWNHWRRKLLKVRGATSLC